MSTKKKKLTFEEALTELEAIVNEIENGDMPLADLLTKYSEGVKLSEFCLQSLQRAEETMDLLIQESNNRVIETELKV